MDDLNGKLALVTGGASGIGLAAAERLRDEGARVVIADVDEANGRAAADKLGTSFHALDVASPEQWSRVVGTLTAEYGGLDIAFLNAGVTTLPSLDGLDIATLSDDHYRRIMGVNIDGVVFGARAVTPALKARGGGGIVITASVAGLIGFPPDPIYTLTKHAVIGLGRSLGPPLAEHGISVSMICPGGVDTNILGPGMAQRAREQGAEIMPPSQIADAVVQALREGGAGTIWVCLAGRPHERYAFAPVEGLRGPRVS